MGCLGGTQRRSNEKSTYTNFRPDGLGQVKSFLRSTRFSFDPRDGQLSRDEVVDHTYKALYNMDEGEAEGEFIEVF